MATMSNISPEEYRALLRNDFSTFVHRSFRELNPSVQFMPTWHNELIATKLEACLRGEIIRLIINVPPRSLKSLQAAVAFPAFVLGHDPSAQIICASYGQDLANKHSLDSLNLMSSARYQTLFPNTRLSPQKQSLQEFATTQNGFRMATSVGGVLTGRGADIIIIDDPLKPDEAVSETQRNAANEWYDHTLYSRLNDKRTGCIIIIIMQRLHEDDLVGHVLEQEQWEHVRLPAIAEEQETHVIRSFFGTRTVHRQPGEALHPEREPLAVLRHIRRTIGEYNFAGQYQQQPSPLGGAIVKAEWFRFYTPGGQPSKFEIVFQSWDTANKSTELSDYSVCTTWGLKRKKLYLLDVYRKRLEFPDLKRAIVRRAAHFRPSNILIEDKASGTALIQDLIRDGIHGITKYEPLMDKIMRLNSVSSTIENGFVYLPEQADWLAEYLHELTTFPSTKHDDKADSTSQALDWVKARPTYPILEYNLQMALARGDTIYEWMIREFNEEQEPVKCPQCGNGSPTQYGRRCHCESCGKHWEQPDPFKVEVQWCLLPDGTQLYWDRFQKLWVNPRSGETYPPGPDPE
jgi:predicted phage terminase large subunit-like protein